MKLALKTPTLLFTTLFFVSANIAACELHGGFGSFGAFHPFAKQHILMYEPAEIELIYDEDINVIADAQSQLHLSYSIPNVYSNVEVTVSASDKIILANTSPFSIAKSRGNMNLEFSTIGTGQHSIVVRVDATQNQAPYSKVLRINVISG